MDHTEMIKRDEELAILNYGQSKVERAKKIANECPVGYLVVHDCETGRVFYKDTNSDRTISTDFTEDDIQIAHRMLPPSHPTHLAWDRLNSTISEPRYVVYTARDK
ncbi:MAG: hypothetical protein JST79_20715 [Acidobacteria bacterium]|nr:hypothetical protein [Acidobacteriota bacterium]